MLSDLKNAPVKSTFSKIRKRISFEFFKEQFDQLILCYEPERCTWRGLRVYATDGDQYELPRSEELLARGFKGTACKREMETYYPYLYVTHCYDVLSGVTKAFFFANENQEFAFAQEIATTLERKSVTLYDRYFFCTDLMRAHQTSGSYFVARIKKAGAGITKSMRDFAAGTSRESSFEFEGMLVRLIRIKNPRTGGISLFATNLPRDRFRNKEIGELYALRWEVETSHRDLSHTLKLGQWHSKHLNGILQELYASLWLMNQTRLQMLGELKRSSLEKLFDYARANFKLLSDHLVRNLGRLIDGSNEQYFADLDHLLRISIEKRRRRTRSYPRQIRGSQKKYPSASLLPRVK